MNPFTDIKSKYHTAGIGIVVIEPPLVDGGVYELCEIYIKSSFRNLGYGTKILTEIIEICDRDQINMVLEASDDFGSDLSRLIKFYERFGFRCTGRNTQMVRIWRDNEEAV